LQIELSCDASLFFHYSANVCPSAYEDIKVCNALELERDQMYACGVNQLALL
jgi:hypothetical protein